MKPPPPPYDRIGGGNEIISDGSLDERAKNIIRQSVFRFLLFIDLLMMLSFEISFLCLIKMCLIPYQVSELLLVLVPGKKYPQTGGVYFV